ncbi:protein Peter pan [Trichogramma pretiosum]|uniref:protein Peter pan n=1 Tax=Trichogramma pretiosum TaxID=7493 RepID=UPI0006C94337|nr:protein Peter pan [Trichogramma pretiosum]
MGRRKKGRCVKNNKKTEDVEDVSLVTAPHSFVIHRGLSTEHVVELTKDFRRVMEPFTATDLKERKRNFLKDFVQVAGPLHVSHIVIFSCTERGMYLKFGRMPRGPTLSFKVNDFTLARDVISSMKKQMVFTEAFKHSPLVILNQFSGEGLQFKLMASMFQNMFPAINLATINLSNLRRCICLSYNKDDKTIDFRHYAIKVVPVGLTKSVKKLVQAKIPNLGKCKDFEDFVKKPAVSDSEAEDDPDHHVILPQKLSSRGCNEDSKSAIRLYEIGPRINMSLIKVEDGLLEGQVLFHEFIHKTDEEVAALEKARAKKRKAKALATKKQEENKKNKELKKEEHKNKSLEGMKRKKKESEILLQKYAKESEKVHESDEDDDAQYYEEEVGEKPDRDLFTKKPKRMKFSKDAKK